jgi:hypothetical protein
MQQQRAVHARRQQQQHQQHLAELRRPVQVQQALQKHLHQQQKQQL